MTKDTPLDKEPIFFEFASTDHEVEAFQYLKLLPEEIRKQVSFGQFLEIKRIVTAWEPK